MYHFMIREGVPVISMIGMALVFGIMTVPNESERRHDPDRTVIAVSGGGYFPVLTRLKDGRLAAVLRGGAPHLGRAGRLDWIESGDGGRSWSAPRAIVDGPEDDRNPAFGQMADGSLVLAYAECTCYNPDGSWNTATGAFSLFYRISRDGGRTWSAKRRLYAGPIGRVGSPFGRIVTLEDGTALMSVYGLVDPDYRGPDRPSPGAGEWVAGVVRSRDNGETWSDWSLISAASHNETTLLPLGRGRILAALRTGTGQVDICSSEDGGRTWSRPQRVTGGSDGSLAEHPADLVSLGGRRILMVVGRRHPPYGIMALLSEDAGRSWNSRSERILAGTSMNNDCGYPSAVRLKDGVIVCLYYSVGTTDLPDTVQAIALRLSEKGLFGPLGREQRQ